MCYCVRQYWQHSRIGQVYFKAGNTPRKCSWTANFQSVPVSIERNLSGTWHQFSGYADNSQNYLSFRPIKDNLTPQHNCTEHLERCLAEVQTWMRYNFLKLNDSKTEFIVFGVHQQLSKVQDIIVTLEDDAIHETPVVRNLGMFFNKELKHTAHVNRLTSSSFLCLQNVARIRHQLDTQTVKTIIQLLVISKLDYCNSILLGIPNYNIAKLQRIQNMACRMVYKLPKSSHITTSTYTMLIG